MGALEGKVAFITGAARGQGRNHAVRLAEEGADIIGVDICQDLATAPYTGPTASDLQATADGVLAAGRRVLTRQVDVRDLRALEESVGAGVSEFGRLDIVIANAGIVSSGDLVTLDEAVWQEMIDVNLTGVWKTIRAACPAIIDGGMGGSVVITSSIAGLSGLRSEGHYAAAKHGVIGLMRTLANELAEHRIRVNAIAPTNVDTVMLQNPSIYGLVRPDLADPTLDDVYDGFVQAHLLKKPWVDLDDITNAVIWLVSDSARYVTGVTLPVDLGLLAKSI